MIPFETVLATFCYRGNNRENWYQNGRDNRLYLNQRDVTDYHFHDLSELVHIPQIGLGAQTRCQAHVEIPFQTQQRRDKND